MDEFHEKAIEQEWPADIDKLSARQRKALVKRMKKAADDMRAERQARLRSERILTASIFARIGSGAPVYGDRPAEKLIEGKTKGMKKKRSVGISL